MHKHGHQHHHQNGKVVEESKEGFRQWLLTSGHFPDPDILLNKDRMEERKALARDTALPASVLMDASALYAGIAEKILGQKLKLSENPKAGRTGQQHCRWRDTVRTQASWRRGPSWWPRTPRSPVGTPEEPREGSLQEASHTLSKKKTRTKEERKREAADKEWTLSHVCATASAGGRAVHSSAHSTR
ncbi:unnamed protein product [Prorocentrum cordatum]|uniref:Uncharacterized protein n=1 Tax=Prorocentrum cordatum TaxID=2364126 RepID=A0ABN9RS25_9DINO|nr:unnamed protein product [Polarella glacialis]